MFLFQELLLWSGLSLGRIPRGLIELININAISSADDKSPKMAGNSRWYFIIEMLPLFFAHCLSAVQSSNFLTCLNAREENIAALRSFGVCIIEFLTGFSSSCVLVNLLHSASRRRVDSRKRASLSCFFAHFLVWTALPSAANGAFMSVKIVAVSELKKSVFTIYLGQTETQLSLQKIQLSKNCQSFSPCNGSSREALCYFTCFLPWSKKLAKSVSFFCAENKQNQGQEFLFHMQWKKLFPGKARPSERHPLETQILELPIYYN